jgi:hypothetical protein
MKKIICVCLCIFLASGCGKLLNSAGTVNTVTEKVKQTSPEPAPTPTREPNGYDEDGYDKDGYNMLDYNRAGYDRK